MLDDAEEEGVGCYHCFFWEVLWAEDEGLGDSVAVAVSVVDSEALVAVASAGEEQAEVIRNL